MLVFLPTQILNFVENAIKLFHKGDKMKYYNIKEIADYFSVSEKSVLNKIKNKEDFIINNKIKYFNIENIKDFPDFASSSWEEQEKLRPEREYTCIELFAGAGGMALGLHKAGFKSTMLNEINKPASKTLKVNRNEWNVVNEDIHNISFDIFKNKIDLLSGGFPCQAFSSAGNKKGFEDTRGTLFFEFARAIKEINPKVFLAENVKGLLSHDKGKTLTIIKNVIDELGYVLIEPRVLNACLYKVPQKRERIILIGIRKDLYKEGMYEWPSIYKRIMTVNDALYKGDLYDSNTPDSKGMTYSEPKKNIMDKVPEGGNWKNLPLDLQKSYLKGSFELGGGKTGIARRLSRYYPSLTLVCSPIQKQTERCHPLENRPLNIREYARIQTFPDEWEFYGSIADQYKQIGNAVPVNLAFALGKSLIKMFNKYL